MASCTIRNAVERQHYHDGCHRSSRRQLDKIGRGSHVKIDFIEGPLSECMWVIVASRDEFGQCIGYLDDVPDDLECITSGELVHFTIDNVCFIYDWKRMSSGLKTVKNLKRRVEVVKNWIVIKVTRARSLLAEYEKRDKINRS